MFQRFLVLGLIPGTNIQIGFFVWAIVSIAIIIFVLKTLIGYQRQVRLHRLMLDVRMPLPASQLHSRLRWS